MSVEDSWYALDRETGKKVRTKRHGRGKRWRVRNRGARTRSFNKRSDADAYDTKVKSELLKGIIPFDHTAGRVLFADYTTKWLKEHHFTGRSRSTVQGRVNTHLIPTFGHLRMCDIRTSTVTAWLAELRIKPSARTKRPLAPTTVAGVYVALSGILRAAVRDKVIAHSPLDGVPYPAPPKGHQAEVWEQATVAELLEALPDSDHAIAALAAHCGHRQSEAFAVAVEDIDFLRRREITIRHQVTRKAGQLVLVPPKGQKVRRVPLPKAAAGALSSHIERYGTTPVRCECCNRVSHVLFVRGGSLLSQQDWNERVWHPAVVAAGMIPSRSTGLHQLRHFYASILIDGGESMIAVQRHLGHASIKVTAGIYGHLFEYAADRARDIIDTAFEARVYPVRTAEIS